MQSHSARFGQQSRWRRIAAWPLLLLLALGAPARRFGFGCAGDSEFRSGRSGPRSVAPLHYQRNGLVLLLKLLAIGVVVNDSMIVDKVAEEVVPVVVDEVFFFPFLCSSSSHFLYAFPLCCSKLIVSFFVCLLAAAGICFGYSSKSCWLWLLLSCRCCLLRRTAAAGNLAIISASASSSSACFGRRRCCYGC